MHPNDRFVVQGGMKAPDCVRACGALAWVMSQKKPLRVVLFSFCFLCSICSIEAASVNSAEGTSATSAASDSLSLFTRLGEESGIARLVDTTMKRILADSSLTPYFKSASPQSISYARKVAINHLCSEADGPCWSFFSSKMLAMVVELNDDLWKRLRGHVVSSLQANNLTGKTAEQTLEIVDQIGRDLLNPLKKK